MCAIFGWFRDASVCASRVNRASRSASLANSVRQDFERDVTIQFRVAGAVDHPHPALADLRDDFVDAESGAGSECQALWIIWARPNLQDSSDSRTISYNSRV